MIDAESTKNHKKSKQTVNTERDQNLPKVKKVIKIEDQHKRVVKFVRLDNKSDATTRALNIC